MADRKTVEFTVKIPQPGEEPLAGKFKTKVRLSYRQTLEMDAMRRQLLGPVPGEPDGMATLLSTALATIRSYCVEVPSWWKDAGNGQDFEDVDVVLTVYNEVNRVITEHLKTLKDAADAARQDLKP